MLLGDIRSHRGVVIGVAVLATTAVAGATVVATGPSTAGGVAVTFAEGVGDTGPEVESWQERLNEWLRLTGSARYPIVVDGDFGPQTEGATREFQRANGAVAEDGTVDDDDRIALEAAISTLEATAGTTTDDADVDQTGDSTDDESETGIDDIAGSDITMFWWQTALNDWLELTDSDLYPIVTDGIFGSQTETATREFQRATDAVEEDGTVGGDDRVAIEAAIESLESAPPVTESDDQQDPEPGVDDIAASDITVFWWQTALNDWLRLTGSDLYPIVVDGDFGPQTESATREFQRADPNVDNDGSVGDDDRVALENAVEALEAAPDADEAASDATDGPSDELVAWWQERLNRWLQLVASSMYPIVVDGDFGPQTETATREFQRRFETVDDDGSVEAIDRVVLEVAIDAIESGAVTPTLSAGTDNGTSTDDDNELVRWWQAGLNDWLELTGSDLYPIVVDGDFGPQTETATREFQRADPNVDNDGTVEDDDRVALENAIAALR